VHRWVHSYGPNPASGPWGMVAFSKVLNKYKDYSRPKSSVWIFPLYFHLPAWRYLFSASGILYGGRYQPGSIGIFSPVEGTSQPVTISKKWKKISCALHRERTWIQALPWFLTCSLGLPGSGTDLKSQKGLYSGPISYT
jgi:hypothetical protein